jgi:hypothetical protein
MRSLTRSAVVAFALMLAVAAPSAFANGSAQNSKLRLTLAGLPATVVQGQSMRATLTLANLTTVQENVSVSFALATPLGNLPVRSSAVNLAPSESKVKRSTFTLTDDAKPGAYRLLVTATVDNTTVTVAHNFTVTTK